MSRIRNYINTIRKPGVSANIYQISHDTLFLDKRALIIGGSSGIGFTIAKKIIAESGLVVITGTNLQKLQNAKTSLGENCKILQWDITKISMAPEMIEKAVLQAGGEIDCLVNCAGVWNDLINFATCSEQDWDSMMNTNLKGIYFATQTYVNRILANKKMGNILMISSERGMYPDDRPYGLSKAALNEYTQALARRLVHDNIRVNGLCPGWTSTEHAYPQCDDNLYTDSTCSKRMMLPEEIAEVACFILSDAASCISGAIIPCNLGNHIRSDW